MLKPHLKQTGSMNVTSAKSQPAAQAAFMLRDLLAIICTLLLLTFLGAPAMKRMNDGSKSAVCMNNLKQLIAAWQMYADENDGRLVENYHGGGTAAAANDPRNAPGRVDGSIGARLPTTQTCFICEVPNTRVSRPILERSEMSTNAPPTFI